MGDQYHQQQNGETEHQVEEEEEEEEAKGHKPLQIPDPPGTHLRIPESELSSDEQSSMLRDTDWKDTLEQ